MSLPVMITIHGIEYFINKQYMVITQSDFNFLIDSKNKLNNTSLSQE